MKRTLFLATAAIAIFGSCTKQKVDEATQGSNLISFESHLGNTTKGTPKAGFAMGDQFFVYGGETGSNDYTLAPSNTEKWVFDGSTDLGVTVTNYGTNWRYSPAVSWSSSKISFFAFSPVPLPVPAGESVSPETYGITQHAPATETEIPKITFQVKGGYTSQNTAPEIAAARAEIKKQVDLLWANSFNNSKSNPTVALPFKHALSQLNFSVRANHAQGFIRINGITVNKVKTKADLVLAHDETKKAEENYLGGWTDHSGLAADVKNFDLNLRNDIASSIAVGKGVQSVLDNDEVLMMIPQATTDIELVVQYAHSIDGVIWENYETGSAVTVKVNSVTSHWKPNTRYNYILNITPGVTIGFTATIEEWDADVKDEEYNEVSAISANVNDVWKYTAEADYKISADYSTTKGQTDWITFSNDNNANSADLTATAVTTTAGEYVFNVKANITPAERIAIITIDKGAKGTVKVKVTQGAGTGIINSTNAAGDVATFNLKTGDKISIPQTKAAASWVKGNGAEIATEYTATGDESYVISVDANTGAARAATVTVTVSSVATTYTIEQAGVDVVPTEVAVAVDAAGVLTTDALAGTISKLTNGSWLKVDGNAIVDGEIVGAGVLTADVNTGAERVATFTTTSADGLTVKNYTVTQAAAAVVPTAVAVAVDAAGVFTPEITLAGETISAVVDGGWLKVGGAAIADGATLTGAVTADVNLTGSQRVATFTTTDGQTVKNYTVTQEAVVPTEVAIAVDITGATFDTPIILAGETISAVVDGGWLKVGADVIADGATLTGTVTAEANGTSAERVAKFTTTSVDGLTVKNYTVTQAGV